MLQKGLLIRKAETEKVEDLMVLPWTRLRVLKGMGGGWARWAGVQRNWWASFNWRTWHLPFIVKDPPGQWTLYFWQGSGVQGPVMSQSFGSMELGGHRWGEFGSRSSWKSKFSPRYVLQLQDGLRRHLRTKVLCATFWSLAHKLGAQCVLSNSSQISGLAYAVYLEVTITLPYGARSIPGSPFSSCLSWRCLEFPTFDIIFAW